MNTYHPPPSTPNPSPLTINHSPLTINHSPPPSSPSLYPLILDPAYKDYLWGGGRIPRVFRRALPDGIYAESWEVSDRPEGPSRVANGPLKGATLGEVLHRFGPALSGTTHPGPSLPLLIKLIDARERLSVQVHPDDASAPLCGGEAKTEAWHVLDAAPGAQVYAGLKPGVTAADFRAALAESRLESCLRSVPVQPGDTLFIPGGRVHAIGEGCLLLEVQQNSNTTYRVYDWGRLGHDGRPRDLHVEKALQVIRWDDTGEAKTVPRAYSGPDGVPSVDLVTSPYFRIERLDLTGPRTCRHDGSGFHALFTAGGAVTIECEGGPVEVPFGRSCLIPAAIREYRLTTQAPGQVLRISVPKNRL
jgi:mannose-6-phosphate isomerase